jgi:hypothetical protein
MRTRALLLLPTLALVMAIAATAQDFPSIFSPSSSSGGGAASPDACELSGNADCQMTGQIRAAMSSGGPPGQNNGYAWNDGANIAGLFKFGDDVTLSAPGSVTVTGDSFAGATIEVGQSGGNNIIGTSGPGGSIEFEAEGNAVFSGALGSTGTTWGTTNIAHTSTSYWGTNVTGNPRISPTVSTTVPNFAFVGDTSTGVGRSAAGTLALFAASASPSLTMSSTILNGPSTTSATLPIYTFQSDPDTGVGHTAADTLALFAGTTSPAVTMSSTIVNGPSATSATLPIFTYQGDTDTGVGRTAANTLAMFSGSTSPSLTMSSTIINGPSATSATLPIFTYQSDADTGVGHTAANTLAMFAGSTTPTYTVTSTQLLGPSAGSDAAPPLSATGSTGTGLRVVSNTIRLIANTAAIAILDATGFIPTSATAFDLGSAAARWRDVYTSGVRGNNTTITILPGTTATSAQGTLIQSYSDDGADATTLRVDAVGGGGSAANDTVVQSWSEAGTVRANLYKSDSTGNGAWSLRTAGTVQLSALTSSYRSTAPASLPTCTAGLSGSLAYREDTDTAGTAPALCVCARADAALTYSWRVIVGTGSCT